MKSKKVKVISPYIIYDDEFYYRNFREKFTMPEVGQLLLKVIEIRKIQNIQERNMYCKAMNDLLDLPYESKRIKK